MVADQGEDFLAVHRASSYHASAAAASGARGRRRPRASSAAVRPTASTSAQRAARRIALAIPSAPTLPWPTTAIAAQPEQDRAAGRVGVQFAPQAAERRSQQQPAERGERAGAGGVADGAGDCLRRPLHQLQGDVAGKAVGDDDVGLGGRKVAALDVADEVDPSAPASSSCASTTSSRPFPASSPTVSRPTRGSLDAEHRLAEGGAEEGELDQVLGAHVDVGADVEEEDRLARHRELHREGRPLHALQAAQAEGGRRHRRPGRAGADHRRGAPLGDVAAARTTEASFLARTAAHGVLLVADPLRGRHDLDPLDTVQAELALGAEDPQRGSRPPRPACAPSREHLEALLGPEAIEGDGHRAPGRHGYSAVGGGAPTARRPSWVMTSRPA